LFVHFNTVPKLSTPNPKLLFRHIVFLPDLNLISDIDYNYNKNITPFRNSPLDFFSKISKKISPERVGTAPKLLSPALHEYEWPEASIQKTF